MLPAQLGLGFADKAKEIAPFVADGTDVAQTLPAARAAAPSRLRSRPAMASSPSASIGMNAFDTDEQEEHRLTSMLKQIDTAVFLITEAVQNGTAGGFQLDPFNDGVGYATTAAT